MDFPTVEYDVLKKHHRHRWLKQKRLLVLQGGDILNAKPRGKPNTPLDVTKRHSLKSLLLIALKSKTSFMLRYQNDHDYFYSSPQALEIVWEVNRRRGAIRAIEQLAKVDGTVNDAELDRLTKLFAGGFLDVPRSDRAENDALERKLDLVNAIRAGAVDGAKDCDRLRALYEARAHGDISLPQFRSELTEIKDTITNQLVNREMSFSSTVSSMIKRKGLPECESDGDAQVCAEEALQTVIAEPLYRKFWSVLLLEDSLRKKQRQFESNRRILATRPIEYFGVRKGLENFNFSLAFDHLESLSKTRNPCELMNVIMVVGKSIILALQASSKAFTTEGSPTRFAACSLSADDMLPMFVLLLARFRIDANYIPFFYLRAWIEAIGDPNECTERAYYFTMYSSAVEYILVGDGDNDDGGESIGEDLIPTDSAATWGISTPTSPPVASPTMPSPSGLDSSRASSPRGDQVGSPPPPQNTYSSGSAIQRSRAESLLKSPQPPQVVDAAPSEVTPTSSQIRARRSTS
jgi:hypothetical protein